MRITLKNLALYLCLLLFISIILAAPNFPTLTGRVIDNANLLKPEVKHQLETKLENYENGTTNQVVVLTLPSLQGYAIDDYGYQLGRHWQIGQKGKNNGVILIVAPTERQVRIEVGYGLEPVLTDAFSNTIIQDVMVPQFKKGNYQQGIIEGTQTILDVLGGKEIKKAAVETHKVTWLDWLILFIIIFVCIRNPGLALLIFAGSGKRFGSSGRGRFGGGGGSFGGGGSSGSW